MNKNLPVSHAPDEIKKGLECCVFDDVENRYPNCSGCPYENHTNCENRLRSDTVAYIQHFESSNAQVKKALSDNGFSSLEAFLHAYNQVKAERDAAVRDLKDSKHCESCKHKEEREALLEYGDIPSQCFNCLEIRSQHLWRGVCAENGGVNNV